MSLRGIAASTLEILEAGAYEGPAGRREVSRSLAAAVTGTRLYTPADLEALCSSRAPVSGAAPRVRVAAERTQEAAWRLVVQEGVGDLVLLNFASARNPGGGFLRGARAQEEDLARCSGLYPCLLAQPEYYAANRAERSLLYTDHAIYSPRVPFFRKQNRDLLAAPFEASVITAPAPNAGQALRRDPHARPEIEAALRRRVERVLGLAADRGHRTLLLGAWGCGVFQNDPAQVTDAFGAWLEQARFAGAFSHVVFAIYDRSKGTRTLSAFERRFAAR